LSTLLAHALLAQAPEVPADWWAITQQGGAALAFFSIAVNVVLWRQLGAVSKALLTLATEQIQVNTRMQSILERIQANTEE
jgi:hypothetical protein